MSVYEVETDNGVYEVEVEDAPETPKSPDLASTLYHGAIEGAAMTVGGAAGAILGSAAGPVGSAVGGVGMAAAAYPPAKRFAEGIDRMRGITPPPQPNIAQEYGEGLAVEATGAVMKPVMGAIGRGLAQTGETLSGAKKDILKQAYKQGYKTYLAPSVETAQARFGQALGSEGQAAMKATAGEAFSSQAGLSRRIGRNAAQKMEAGGSLGAIEALKARQATDRVISATPLTDKKALGSLYEWRGKFDDTLSTVAPDIKDASNLYRQAIVRDTLLNPMRITKSGRPSAFLPLVLGAGARGAAGVLSVAAGASPALWGLGATTAGQVSRAMTPTVKRAIYSQFIDRITTKD